MTTNDPIPEKIVIVITDEIDPGTAANTCALLSLTLGARNSGLIGPDVVDHDRRVHTGISTVPVPVLHAPDDQVRDLALTDREGVSVVGFSRQAASCHTYDIYTTTMAATSSDELRYLGVALAGTKKAINSLTGSLPLYR